MKINKIKQLGKSKDKIIINDYFAYKLTLRKEKMFHGKERVCLTAKKIGYTTKGMIEELKGKRI